MVGQVLVVKAHQVQGRGMEVADVVPVDRRLVPQITRVSSSIPRCARSESRPATGWSISGQ